MRGTAGSGYNVSMADRENPHIGDDKQFTYYHRVVQGLVVKYTPPGGRVLDIGCGMGHLLALIRDADRDYVLTGADAFENCLETTSKRVPEASRILIGDEHFETEKLGGPYEAVTMIHTLEHVLDPVASVRGAMSLVEPGGHLFLAVPNPVRPQMFVASLIRHHYVNRGHVCAWDRSHWMNFLGNILDLDVVEYAQDEVRLFPSRVCKWIPPMKMIEVGASKLTPWWSFSNIAVVRKGVRD